MQHIAVGRVRNVRFCLVEPVMNINILFWFPTKPMRRYLSMEKRFNRNTFLLVLDKKYETLPMCQKTMFFDLLANP